MNSKLDPYYKGPSLISGYLNKIKSSSLFTHFFKKYNKRFFVLDLNKY